MSPPITPTGEPIEKLLRDHHEAGWGWALACCRRRRHDAEEVLQKAYLKVLEGRARFHGRSAFRTWWFGVIRITALEHRRWAVVRSWWSPLSGAEANGHRRQDDLLADYESGAELNAALARLSQRQREVIHLVFYEGTSIAEAAEVLGISVGSARQHHERGKANLLAALRERGMEAR